jgi:hypothetical protein
MTRPGERDAQLLLVVGVVLNPLMRNLRVTARLPLA